MSSYRKTAAEGVGHLINNAPYNISVVDLRRLLRERGPRNVKSPEFRIWHHEARRQLNGWVKAKRDHDHSRNLFNT